MISHLKQNGVDAAVIGSVGVLHHLQGTPEAETFRPTVDLDVFVKTSILRLQRLKPPTGWQVDRESVGVVSWISPSGGYVDFLAAGQTFPSGERVPSQIQVHAAVAPDLLPFASVRDLFKLKLNSMRAKDLTDLLALAKSTGRPPTPAELGTLNATQRENLDLINQWLTLPSRV